MHCVANKILTQAKVKELGFRIRADYIKRPLVVVGIANGALILLVDLIRAIGFDCRVEVITARHDRGIKGNSAGVTIGKLERSAIAGRDVVVVDEIVETGATAKAVISHIKDLGARSVELCTLLIKESDQGYPIIPKYCGLIIDPRAWVVGYGMDLDDRHRTQSYIGIPPEKVAEMKAKGVKVEDLKHSRHWEYDDLSQAS